MIVMIGASCGARSFKSWSDLASEPPAADDLIPCRSFLMPGAVFGKSYIYRNIGLLIDCIIEASSQIKAGVEA